MGINIEVGNSVTIAEASSFFKEFLTDKESQKIFREFTSARVKIWLATEYFINDASILVLINVHDGVKKTAKWLATGKI